MTAAYEDNFGFWEIDGPEERAFFEHVQRQSVHTTCKRCKQPVRLTHEIRALRDARRPWRGARRRAKAGPADQVRACVVDVTHT